MKKVIRARFVQKTGKWMEDQATYINIERRETMSDIVMEIVKQDRPILMFLGGPTGYESYYIDSLLSHPHEHHELCICAGTINSWRECYVPTADVMAFLKEEGFEPEAKAANKALNA